jgi:hypothetical protein
MFIISNIFAGNINGERYRAEILTPFLNGLHDDELIYGYFQQDVVNNIAKNEQKQKYFFVYTF